MRSAMISVWNRVLRRVGHGQNLPLLGVLLLVPATSQAQPIVTKVVLSPPRIPAGTMFSPQWRLPGFSPNITPGQPALPEKELLVIVHPDIDPHTLELSIQADLMDTMPGCYRLPPNPPLQVIYPTRTIVYWGSAGTVVDGRDVAAYRTALFPARVVRKRGLIQRQGMKLLRLLFSPLRYRHQTGELLIHRHAEVVLRYALKKRKTSCSRLRVPGTLFEQAMNPTQGRSFYETTGLAAEKTGYAIIIPQHIAQTSQKLEAFIQHKEQRGMTVTVVQESDLATIPIADKAGDAERVRGWLQKHVQDLALKYVLLVGNPDPTRAFVPMKMVHPTQETIFNDADPSPSDHYYANLTGNWDLDGDGLVAEFPADQGEGGMDFHADVLVGRIPLYDDNVTMLDKILAKTMAYEQDTSDRSWRFRVLQPAAFLWFKDEYGEEQHRLDGAEIAELIYQHALAPLQIPRTTLYEQLGLDQSQFNPDRPLSRDSLVQEWRQGYGVVSMVGHGSPDGIFRHVWVDDDGNQLPDYGEVSDPPFFSYDDIHRLDDTHPSFVFHGSCSNGTPERPDNLAYGLLRHGAIATVAASRPAAVVFQSGQDETNWANIFGVEREFLSLLMQKQTVGEALFAAKESISDKLGALSWAARLQLNLYGDPSVSIFSCRTNEDCDDGQPCNGQETCQLGQCLPGTSVHCPALAPCQDASCDASTGQCQATPRPDGEACDDFLFCTINDTCQGGQCQGEPRCQVVDNPCVAATCNEQAQTCDVASINEEQVCHVGSVREGVCRASLCRPSESTGCSIIRGSQRTAAAEGLFWIVMLGVLLMFQQRQRRKRTHPPWPPLDF